MVNVTSLAQVISDINLKELCKMRKLTATEIMKILEDEEMDLYAMINEGYTMNNNEEDK